MFVWCDSEPYKTTGEINTRNLLPAREDMLELLNEVRQLHKQLSDGSFRFLVVFHGLIFWAVSCCFSNIEGCVISLVNAGMSLAGAFSKA